MVTGNEGNKRGVPGSDAGRPCPSADKAAVGFVRSYRPAIDWALHQACIPVADRPDLVQDITIRILRRFRKHGALGSDGSQLGYAITVARSVIADYRRRQAQTTKAHADAEAVERTTATDLLPDAQAMRLEAHCRLRYAIASLSPMRRYLMERILAGDQLAEIAAHHELSFGALRVQYHRAVKDLRERLVRRP